MMIIDAHAHIFSTIHGRIAAGPTEGREYGFVAAGGEAIRVLPPYNRETSYTLEMLLANLEWAGVDQAVLLQGPFYGECNEYVAEAVRGHPKKLCGAAYLDPWTPGCRENLDQIIDQGSFVAVKLECSVASGYFGVHPEADLGSEDLSWLWQSLERHGLVLVLDLGAVGSRSYQTQAVRAIAQQHPDLKIVIAHLGQPGPLVEAIPPAWSLWQEQIDLGKLANVWFDSAALPAYLPDEDFPFPTAGRYLRFAIERIGPEKVLWGTDQPGLLIHASLPQLVRLAFLHTEFLSPDERALFLGGNARKVYSK
jgi:predicted TIM-barrel fold metal-dependent hydrolase